MEVEESGVVKVGGWWEGGYKETKYLTEIVPSGLDGWEISIIISWVW